MTKIGSRASPRTPRSTPLLHHSNTPLLQRFAVMRKFYTLLSREVRGYFHSPIAYIVLIFFLIVSGIDFYFQVSFMNQRQVQYTVQEAFFNSVFFWFAFVLIFPLITMRLFAEEFKLGTIEPLTTAPVRDWQVVLSKFFGPLFFFLILCIPRGGFFFDFREKNKPAGGAFSRSILRLLPDAVAAWNVLSFHWLPHIGADAE